QERLKLILALTMVLEGVHFTRATSWTIPLERARRPPALALVFSTGDSSSPCDASWHSRCVVANAAALGHSLTSGSEQGIDMVLQRAIGFVAGPIAGEEIPLKLLQFR